ncbi:DUF481 domain-containing protein [Parasphingorhabdus cellanae]|uniref:DUF481 domain-containing protein n=1 Tax=Parasphingorhabdus cellanae TaxID=2806553 RepID=A0ABX7T331_9SPHN|nr:DUF481 domain-containing protein [Parasphingorhabdus cellanae]QTD55971.1 DUF481 domain-containing protein [Parasphingorhabdus cellanae]
MLRKIVCSIPIATIGLTAPAQAALPAPVKAMIQAAIDSGKHAEVKSVIKFAKVANPDSIAEIDAMMASYTVKKTQLAAAKRRAKMEAPFFENWSGKGELGGFRNTGNSSGVGLSGGINLVKDAVDWRLKFQARADYQRSNGVTSREQYAVAVEPEYKINDRLFVYGLARYDHDRFQGFSARYTASGGIGYTVVKEDEVNLDVKAGPAWRLTEFTDGGSDSSLAGLIGLDLGWQIADNLKLTQDAGATLASDAQSLTSANVIFSSGTNTLTATTGLDAKINGKLTARFSYAVEHETNPPDGSEKTDTLSRATLVYDF